MYLHIFVLVHVVKYENVKVENCYGNLKNEQDRQCRGMAKTRRHGVYFSRRKIAKWLAIADEIKRKVIEKQLTHTHTHTHIISANYQPTHTQAHGHTHRNQ